MARRALVDKAETRLSPVGAASEEAKGSESGQEAAEAAPTEALAEQAPEEGPSERAEERTQALVGAGEEAATPTPAAGTSKAAEPEEAACGSAPVSSGGAGGVMEPAGLLESGEQLPPAAAPGTSTDPDG